MSFREVDQRAAAGDIAAAAHQGFRQRAEPDIDAAGIDALHLENAAAGRAQDAQRMRVVDHQPAIVLGP